MATKKKKKAKSKKLTPVQIDEARASQAKALDETRKLKDWETEQKLLKQYEIERPDLAPWVGWEEYKEARGNEARIKAVGLIGAIMRGEKRGEIRKKWRISSAKLNTILNSDMVNNVLAYSLGYLYSFQSSCVQAILYQLNNEHDGHLAVVLLEKLGLFSRMERILQQGGSAPDAGEETPASVEDAVAIMFARGDSLQARQAREAIERIVVEAVKTTTPK
jgi:hypothetical protein